MLRLAARVGALEGAAPPPLAAWSDGGGRRGAARDRGGGLRAGPQRGRAPSDRAAVASPSSAPTPPRRARSAAAARPSSRPTPSRRSTACARRSATCSTSVGVRATSARAAAAGRSCWRAPARCDSSAPDGDVLALRAAGVRRVQLDERLPGGPADRGRRGGRVPRAPARRRGRRAPDRLLGRGPFRLDLDGREAFDDGWTCRPGADPVEGIMRPPQHAVSVTLEAGAGARRRRPLRARGRSVVRHRRHHVPDQCRVRRAAPTTTSSTRAVALARDGRRRGGRGRHDRGGRERGLRPRLARAARPPGRAGAARSPPPTRGRSSWSTPGAPVLLPWADEVAGGAAELVPRPGVRQRAGRRAARRRRARRPAADDLARRPRRACPRRSRSTASCPTTRACSSATAPTTATGASRAIAFGHGLGYTSWEYLDASRRGRHGGGARAQQRAIGAGARSCRSTRRGPTARSSARRAGSSASRAWRPIPARRSWPGSRFPTARSRIGTQPPRLAARARHVPPERGPLEPRPARRG